jgi:hypothetical protein
METSSKFKVLAVGLALVACACGSSSDTIPCPYGGTAPAISSFRATPSMLSAAGGSITLSWDITGATSIAIDPDVGDVTDIASNSKTIAVTSTRHRSGGRHRRSTIGESVYFAGSGCGGASSPRLSSLAESAYGGGSGGNTVETQREGRSCESILGV